MRPILRTFAIAAAFTLLFYMAWYMFAVNISHPIQGIVMITAAILIAFAASKAVHPSGILPRSGGNGGGLSTRMSILLLILFVIPTLFIPRFIMFIAHGR